MEVMPSTASTQAVMGTALVLRTAMVSVHVDPGAAVRTKYDLPKGTVRSGVAGATLSTAPAARAGAASPSRGAVATTATAQAVATSDMRVRGFIGLPTRCR